VKSEKEKMLAGEPYRASDPELSAERRRARLLFKEFNDSRPDEREKRARLLQQLIPRSGRGLWIEPPFYCDYGSNIVLGEHVYFNFNCVILDVAPVRIGSHVLFGPSVQVYTATHPLSAAARRTGVGSGKPIEIGDGAWIGGGAILCPGVRIGAQAVIGAGSVVTEDVAERVFAAGNPCRVVRAIEE